MNQNFDLEESRAELQIKVKETIRREYPNWRKSKNGQLLFFAIFRVQKERTLYDLNVPELKTLCASYDLPCKFYNCSKTILQASIETELLKKFPNHPTRKNVLIFLPDNETEI